MTHTKPQERLLQSMQRGQKAHFVIGWRLLDGTPVHARTIQSLASRGEVEPAGTDLLGDRVTCYTTTPGRPRPLRRPMHRGRMTTPINCRCCCS
ncbi:hypothetical protein SAMN05192556_11323 [Halomonas caseinilytica]|uniref:Uncharacterized protein n=1 Tax=Halomonas caseinilytica TaxID=438744 RepID=A0A1M7ACS9_9GAMM|nr:hypothetical protein SAMN04487952_12018 [Halomonas caseinilytica]SHL40500.1 hypothetical protein SAMN05192556_11323 [Halomonas caseinilytica]